MEGRLIFWCVSQIDLLNRELPDLPPRTSDIRDEFDDDEVRKHFEQLDRIAARIRV